MNDELKEQINNEADGTDGLSQEKIADLFKQLDEAYLNSMLERAGLTEDDLAAAEEAQEESVSVTADDEVIVDTVEDTPSSEEAIPSEDVSPSDEAAAIPLAAAGGELEPEHIGHLLKVLGDDIINEMLQDAGLTEEDLLQAEAASEDETGSSAVATPVKQRVRKKGKAKTRFLLLAIVVGIILLVFAVNQISMNVTLNSDDPIQYSEQTDDISALEGSLIVNDVNVSVPTDGSEEYSISYSWAEDDDKYPSVPHAITAVYSDKEGLKLYTISLYRSETVKKKNIPKGKKASNWFDDWETISEGDVLQNPLKAGKINGFYIYPQMNEEGSGPSSDYNNYSYYFAVKERGGISVYILEGVCLDEESAASFPAIMDNCIKSIKVTKEKKDTEAQPESDSEAQQA